MGTQKDGFKKLNEVVSSTLKMTQKKSEEVLKEFLKSSESQKEQIKDLIEEIATKSKKSAEAITDTIKAEVTKQIKEHDLISKEELKKVIETVVDSVLAKQRHGEHKDENSTSESETTGSDTQDARQGRSRGTTAPKATDKTKPRASTRRTKPPTSTTEDATE